ncbi:MAG: hypothetical protein WBF58_18730 [Xanthobacteraceae bacterium]
MDAIDVLAETTPATFAGLVAKARVGRMVRSLAQDTLAPSLVRDIGVLAGEVARQEAEGRYESLR